MLEPIEPGYYAVWHRKGTPDQGHVLLIGICKKVKGPRGSLAHRMRWVEPARKHVYWREEWDWVRLSVDTLAGFKKS